MPIAILMHPILIKVFGIPVYSYGTCLALAFLVCILLSVKKAKTLGIPSPEVLDLILYLTIFGIIGARILYVVINYEYYSSHILEISFLNKGGLIFYGGFIGAFIAGFIFAKRHKLVIPDVADLIVLYLPLGQAIGRIGCYLNGCCYGKPTNSIFGVMFPRGSFAAEYFGAERLIYPVQIYSSILDIIIFIILLLKANKKLYKGQIVFYYMMFYGVGRFYLETMRADNPPVFYGLNTPQLISITISIIGLLSNVIILCLKKFRGN